MYSSCMVCNANLGANEVLEHFPVGRRLAYDAAKGRLWVVCPHCARWNLTPLEERWEAMEDAERLFHSTRLRTSTENIGLARMRDGTDVIRIGTPLRPELAAWRYGRRFTQRRRRTLIASSAAAAALGAVGIGAVATSSSALLVPALIPVGAMGLLISLAISSTGNQVMFTHRFIRDSQGQYLRVTSHELPSVRLVSDSMGWGLRIPYASRRATREWQPSDLINQGSAAELTLHGRFGLDAARILLPLVNGQGASASHVSDAVGLVSEWGDADAGFTQAASQVHQWAKQQMFGDTGALGFLPREVRLALEMTAFEEQERRALEGELADLERAWREAEEVAAIADDLLVPDGVTRALKRLRGVIRP